MLDILQRRLAACAAHMASEGGKGEGDEGDVGEAYSGMSEETLAKRDDPLHAKPQDAGAPEDLSQ